jgi:hypothetical protein
MVAKSSPDRCAVPHTWATAAVGRGAMAAAAWGAVGLGAAMEVAAVLAVLAGVLAAVLAAGKCMRPAAACT